MSNNPAKYGPWAGKLLTGDDFTATIYSVDTNGAITPYNLGIAPDTIQLIYPNQDFYCIDFAKAMLLKISRTWLTRYVGDILMIQAGKNGFQPVIFLVHWNGTAFEVHGIRLWDDTPFENDIFEKGGFAPVTFPTIE